MVITNAARVGDALKLLQQGLKPFVAQEMNAVYKGEWHDVAKRHVNPTSIQETSKGKPDYDVPGLLSIMSREWNDVFGRTLGNVERGWVAELKDVRHRWAHNEAFSTDDAQRALDTIQRMLKAVSAGEQAQAVEESRQQLLHESFHSQAGATKGGLAGQRDICRAFWTQLLHKARARTDLHANISATTDSWVTASAGVAGLGLAYVVNQHSARVELYIDRGKGTDEETMGIFDELHAHREDIESKFGGPIEWLRLDGKRACRITHTTEIGGYLDREKWPELQDTMIDAMIRFEAALRPHIDALEV
jgi:hypothetical protein